MTPPLTRTRTRRHRRARRGGPRQQGRCHDRLGRRARPGQRRAAPPRSRRPARSRPRRPSARTSSGSTTARCSRPRARQGREARHGAHRHEKGRRPRSPPSVQGHRGLHVDHQRPDRLRPRRAADRRPSRRSPAWPRSSPSTSTSRSRCPTPRSRRSAETATAAAVAAPGAGTPDDNPYMPTNEIGSITFKAAHPTWDGRGVTIGVIDSGVDLDHPALQKTTTGERKIVDWVTATDPIFDGDATWRPMLTTVTADAATHFTVLGVSGTWTAPAASAAYRFNRFSEAITAGSEPGGDVNRDGDTTDRFGILYDPTTHDIWVDANQNLTFEASEKMRPYKETGSTSATSAPTTRRPPSSSGCRSSSSTARTSTSRPYERPDAPGDRRLRQHRHRRGRPRHPRRGHRRRQRPLRRRDGRPGARRQDRLLARLHLGRRLHRGRAHRRHGRPRRQPRRRRRQHVDRRPPGPQRRQQRPGPALRRAHRRSTACSSFISAGNSGAGVNTIGDPSVATDVVSVASSVSKETWLSNYGSVVTTPLTLHNYSSRGPREDGGFKPNVMAPGSAVSSVPQWLKQPDVAETGYTLPDRLRDVQRHLDGLPAGRRGRRAAPLGRQGDRDPPVTRPSCARRCTRPPDFVKGVDAISQGNGQVDVPKSWDLLRTQPVDPASTRPTHRSAPRSPTSSRPPTAAPASTTAAPRHQAATAVGQTKAYAVKVTRTSGQSSAALAPGAPHRQRRHLLGADVGDACARAAPRRSPSSAKPRTTGLHSAILADRRPGHGRRRPPRHARGRRLRRPRGAVVLARRRPGRVERNLVKRHFVTVPEGAKALQVNLAGTAAEQPDALHRLQPVRRPRRPDRDHAVLH